MKAGVFLAALAVDLPKNNRPFGKTPSLLLSDMLLIIGLGLAVLLVLAAGVYISMKLRRNRRRHVSGGEKVYRRGHHAHASESEVEDGAVGSEGSEHDQAHEDEDDHDPEPHADDRQSRRRYKYRVRRRTHRTRNPTLSETGGLPPVKAEQPTKPL